jgi:hypothetical protein
VNNEFKLKLVDLNLQKLYLIDMLRIVIFLFSKSSYLPFPLQPLLKGSCGCGCGRDHILVGFTTI